MTKPQLMLHNIIIRLVLPQTAVKKMAKNYYTIHKELHVVKEGYYNMDEKNNSVSRVQYAIE